MDAYSLDLRERVLGACKQMPQRKVAEAFRVSLSFITKLRRRQRRTGSIAPKPHGGGRKPMLDPVHQKQVRELVKEQCDATLAEYCRRLADRKAPRVSQPTMCRVLARLGLHRKKRVFMPPSATRRGCKDYAGNSPGKSPGFLLGSWSVWTKVVPPRR